MHSGRQILKSTSVISVFTGLSRLLGFFREIAMAKFFGTSLACSAFNIAFRTPNLFRAILGEGALNAAFVPVFAETMEKEGQEKAQRVASSIFVFMGIVLLTIVACGVLVLLYFRSYRFGESWDLVVPLTSITLPYLLFICLAALCMGVSHSYGKFWVPAASQGLLNVVWIAVLYFVCPVFGETPFERIYAVAWGVIVAGAAQLAFQAYFLKRLGFNPRPYMEWNSAPVRKFLSLMTPVVFGSSITQLNVYVSGLLALYAGTWAPAALGYAERLIYLPLGVFATALGSVLLPTFSRQASLMEHDDLKSTLNDAIRNICLVMTPVAAGLFALGLPFVSLVLKRGEFNEQSAILTARALVAYSPGLIVFSIYKVVLPAFYGMQDTGTPVRVAVFSALINLLMNIASILYLPDGYQQAGLAASNVISSIISCSILLFMLDRKVGGLGFGRTGWSIVSTFISGALMAATCMRVYARMQARYVTGGTTVLTDMFLIVVSGMAGLLVYGAARMMVSRNETVSVMRLLMRRGRK